jgi:DNA polymerase V
MPRTYAAIDLKSFFASVECILRGLDPLKAKLVVADESRTEKTICLAVTPALKAYGIPGRARLFEVNQKVREVQRRTGEKIEFTIAKPQMAKYVEYSTKVYNVYLKYVSAEDIHAYSIDECFLDLTRYLKLYKKTPRELVKTIIQDVFTTTGITATGGIGTNLYLCKIAMDVMAKHVEADNDGVRIAELDFFFRKLRDQSVRILVDRNGFRIIRLNITHGDPDCSVQRIRRSFERILRNRFTLPGG